jgi:plasmid stability protein
MSECGRHQLAAFAMLLSFAVQKAVTQQWARECSQYGAFLEIAGALDKDFRDQLVRIHEDNIDASETRAADAGHFRAQLFQHAHAVAEQRAKALDEAGHRYNAISDSIESMATITIRGLDDAVKKRLRVRAARHGRSMEEEAREILKIGVSTGEREPNLAESIRALFEPLGGVDLPEFPDKPVGDPIRFDE